MRMAGPMADAHPRLSASAARCSALIFCTTQHACWTPPALASSSPLQTRDDVAFPSRRGPLVEARAAAAMGKIGKGTGSFGKRHNKTHTLCVRCGGRSYHIQKHTCSACGYPAARKRSCACPGNGSATAYPVCPFT